MLSDSAPWFVAQLVLAAIMVWLGRVVARRRAAVWRAVAIVATGAALLWPLMRWFPDRFLHLLGSRVLMHIDTFSG